MRERRGEMLITIVVAIIVVYAFAFGLLTMAKDDKTEERRNGIKRKM